MNGEFEIKCGLPRIRRERREKRCTSFYPSTLQIALQPFFATSSRCAGAVLVSGLALAFAVFSGCATTKSTGTIAQQPVPAVASVAKQEPKVSRLEDGREGFVIKESPSMDGESREAFERAVAMMNSGNNDKAIELLKKVIERSPGVTAPYIDIAVAYLRTGKTDPAEQHLKTALGLVPHHPVASNEYGLLLRKNGRFKEAREIYEEALAKFPDYLPIHRNLGILCDLYLNDPECALNQFEIYSKSLPADGQVKTWIAELRMRLGRPDPKPAASSVESPGSAQQAEPKQESKPAEASGAAIAGEPVQNEQESTASAPSAASE